MKTKSKKITLGTKEWADSNVNCYYGCSNDCRYCYAKKMAIRFKRKTEETWKIMEPNYKSINKGYFKRKGRIMFPTSHDITTESLDYCIVVLKKLIDVKNEVLITTKPMLNGIKKICNIFDNTREIIQFRFTITSKNNYFLNFWEPNAPLFEERLESLKYAYNYGYKTSVSIEPFLDKDPYDLVNILIPYVTESIWIGKMNYIQASNLNSREKKNYMDIRAIYSKNNLSKIIKKALTYEDSIIQIKDSIFNYLYQ